MCARPGCASTASASLTYAYADGVVWMGDLEPEGHPMIHDLCTMHSERVKVPRGWTLDDTRSVSVGTDLTTEDGFSRDAAERRSPDPRQSPGGRLPSGDTLRLVGA